MFDQPAKSIRAPYQILVLPFIKEKGEYYYALFRREDMDVWQGIAGGGENSERPIETAKREAHEEGLIPKGSNYIKLSTITTIPATSICGFKWGEKIAVIPEFTFGVELSSKKIEIGQEHTEYQWFSFEEATNKLKWDSNKTALWELNYRLKNMGIEDIKKNTEIIKRFL